MATRAGRAALTDQLVGRYLLISERRHGILSIDHHKYARFWRDKIERRAMRFADVSAELQRLAEGITEKCLGSCKVSGARDRRDRAAALDAPCGRSGTERAAPPEH